MDENVAAGVAQALSAERPLDEELSRALAGALFPLSRADLVFVARENEAPVRLVTLLSGAPDQIFRTLREVQDVVTPS